MIFVLSSTYTTPIVCEEHTIQPLIIVHHLRRIVVFYGHSITSSSILENGVQHQNVNIKQIQPKYTTNNQRDETLLPLKKSLQYIFYNYTLYKNHGFWLVNSRCIFRVFSYLGLISFIFTAAGVFA